MQIYWLHINIKLSYKIFMTTRTYQLLFLYNEYEFIKFKNLHLRSNNLNKTLSMKSTFLVTKLNQIKNFLLLNSLLT